MTQQRILEVAALWGRKNIDALMLSFTDDCVYKASVGSAGNHVYRSGGGACGCAQMFAHDHGSTSEITNMHISANHGFREWTYRFPDGRVVFGCDLFEFVGDQVRVKNAFRKTPA